MVDRAIKPGHRSRLRPRVRKSGVVVMALVLFSGLLSACASSDDRTGVSLILKTQTNPYFVVHEEGSPGCRRTRERPLSVAAGTQDGDTQNQIDEIYTAIARGDKGILITRTATRSTPRCGRPRRPVCSSSPWTPRSPGEHRRHHLRHRQRAAGQARSASTRRPSSTASRPSSPCSTSTTTRSSRSTPTVTRASWRAWASSPATRARTAGGQGASTPPARAASTRWLSPADPGRHRRRADGDGAVPVGEPERQRGLLDQRAGRSGRLRRTEGRGQAEAGGSSPSTAAARASSWSERGVRRRLDAVPRQDGAARRRARSPRSPPAAKPSDHRWQELLRHRHRDGRPPARSRA